MPSRLLHDRRGTMRELVTECWRCRFQEIWLVVPMTSTRLVRDLVDGIGLMSDCQRDPVLAPIDTVAPRLHVLFPTDTLIARVCASTRNKRGHSPCPLIERRSATHLLTTLLQAACFIALAGSGACNSDKFIAPADTTQPQFQIISPHDTLYDLDGDKLVDVSLLWRDSSGHVDPSTARLRTLRPLNGLADTSTNLLNVWHVVRLDTGGLLVRETLANLLPDGQNQLEISVSDSVGNRRVDTLILTLPHGALFRTIPTGVISNTDNVSDIGIDSAGHLGFATVSKSLVVFNPDSLRLISVIPVPTAGSRLQRVVLDERMRVAYAGEGRIQRFDLTTNTWVGTLSVSFSTAAMAFSRATPSLMYTGEDFAGWMGYLDIVANTRLGEMQLPHTFDEFIFDIKVLAGDRKLYMTRYDEGGILVIDPIAKQVLKHITVARADMFFTDRMTLTRDEQHIYVALRDADPRGVGDLDTQLDSIVRVLNLELYVPQGIALSPSQRRIFLTTQDRFPNFEAPNVLIDVPTWRSIQEFGRPRAAGSIRRDGPVVFRPDGKLIFVGRDLDIDIYLNRETP